jgi:hypothetical protein
VLTDILYSHNDDLEESLGTIYGINVYPNPRIKTLLREDRYRRSYVKACILLRAEETVETEHTHSPVAKAPEIEFKLASGLKFLCRDNIHATLTCDNIKRYWCLTKDSGVTYSGYSAEEMQRVLRLEVSTNGNEENEN